MIRWLAPLLFIVLPLQAGVFKWQSDDGIVHYSDTPRPGAEELQLQKERSTAQQSEVVSAYSLFEIESPTDGQTLRRTDGQVSVGLSLNPTLQEGHKIRYLFDGKTLDKSLQRTHIALQNVTFGSHSLQAEIVDSVGKRIKSTSLVRFHLRQPGI